MLTKQNDNYFEGGSHRDPILNWRFLLDNEPQEANQRLADGYYETCMELVNMCIEDNSDKKGDIWIFPIMFQAHQFFELYLKCINLLCKLIVDSSLDPWSLDFSKGGHDLEMLLSELGYNLGNLSQNTFINSEDLTLLKDYVAIFKSVSGAATSLDLRYACNKTKEKNTLSAKTFYTKGGDNIHLNISRYKCWLEELHDILYNTFCGLDDYYTSRKEFMGDMSS